MDKKKRGRQKSLVSRLQLTPENTKVPHMVEGKFIKPKQASMEDVKPLAVSSAIPSELRTAVYRAEGSKKHKVKAEEGKMGFAYVFSKIHKEKIKPIVGQCTELTEWDQHQSMEYSELGDMNDERLSLVPLQEESSCTSDVSSDVFIESKGENEKSEILPVSTRLSCHKRTCMKFQAGYDHKTIREKKPPCYDKTEPIIDDVVSHILRLRDRLGWETSLPRRGFVAKPENLANFQKITLPKGALQKDDGEFVYCLIRSRNDPKADYDPYDLQVVSPSMAKQSKEYWTVTASYVSKFTSVCGKEEMEIIPVIEWLCERQIYYALRSIDICFNFRKRKYFITWKSNAKRSKIENSKMLLYKRLFLADEILQKCLLYIQALCEDVSNTEKHKLSEDKTISFIKIDISHTYTLDEFCEEQYKQSQQALTQLQDFKDKVIKVIRTSFLKPRWLSLFTDYSAQKTPWSWGHRETPFFNVVKAFLSSDSVLIAEMKGAEKLFLHLPDDARKKPKHFEIAGWRHIMEDFSRFLQLVDRMFQELLRKLVHNALNLLLEIFEGSNNKTVSKLKTNEDLIWYFHLFMMKTLVQNVLLYCIVHKIPLSFSFIIKYRYLQLPFVLYLFKNNLGFSPHIRRAYKKTIERANSLSNTENRHQQMFQANYFEISQASSRHSEKPEPQVEIITVSDISKILEDVKRQLRGEEEYVPIFKINIELRIPYEKELCRKYIQEEEDDYLSETSLVPFNETLEDEDLKQLSPSDRQSKHEGSENSVLLQSNASSDEKTILSRTHSSKSNVESLKYKSSPAFATDFYLAPNRREFSMQFQGIVDALENIIAKQSVVRNPVLLLSETLPKMANEIIESLIEEAADISEKIMNYANYQTVFDSSVSEMKSASLEKMSHGAQSGDCQRATVELSEIESDLVLRKLLWDSRQEWARLFFKWKHTIFWNLDVDLIQRDVNRFMQIVQILEKGLPENTILPAMKKSLYEFKEFLPIIIALRNPCLQLRHWETIQNIVKQTINGDKRLTLDKILEFNMFQYRKEINEVSVTASNEATLEAMLKRIIDIWYKTEFHLSQYHTETSTTLIISSAEDIIALLEDSQVTISTIKGSCFIGPIKSLVDAWDRKLNLFSCTLEEWLNCQRNWIYLEPIFCAPEIKRQLPEESNLFSQVDSKWKDLMKRTEDNPNALRATTTAGVFETLQTNNAHLEKIQKALEDYLEVKRMVFPRFYFLSNAELIEILADSKNHDVVQPHLVKCFANIRKLYIRPQEQRPPVVLMIGSAEGEILLVPKNVRIRGPAELWLGNVENTMYDMVRKFITVGIAEWNQMEFKEWFFTHPGQVILLVSQIMFSRACEMSLSSSHAKMELKEGRNDLISLIEELAAIASDILPYHKQSTLEALVTLIIHCRDVMTVLINNDICSAEDFAWTRQLRYEWHDVNPCKVIQGFASFEYGFEYLGCSPRLVITPLTDRCWLTITGALQLNLGGCLSGPAGTGKTETVKDLSKALGKLCLVFNCSEGLDDKVMGKLLCGLVQSGAWCCFDEFNRIDVEVLSAIASQIQAIKAAKDSCAVRFLLEGKEVRLKPFCAIFITMNPGYKGRVELPDNLKSLFRPVSMMVPDYQLIAEIMLCSEGFRSAKSLSEKIVNLYHLSSKQLSRQDHYDFGMRAIKTVLIRAGQKRQELKTQNSKKKKFSTSEETLIITTVLKEVNLPKFLAEDVPLFEDILTDLFPGMKVQKVKHRRLQSAISVAIQHLCLQRWENQIQKVIQFYNQIMASVGIMLVGPTGGGKTTIRTILEKALVILPLVDTESNSKLEAVFQNSPKKGKVDTFVINPKCVSLGELFGQTNPNTMEWSDGLLSSAVRAFAKLSTKKPKKKDISTAKSEMQDLYTLNTVNLADASLKNEALQSRENFHCESINDWQWIILDGPVDPVWIENLNSVLDDSRVLCLPNSERIYLSPAIRMIFEVDSLSQASPATVSRCAMVYVDPVDLGWEPYVSTWLDGFSELLAQNDIEYLSSLFHSSVKKGMNFLNERKKMQPFPIHQMGIVMNICRILDSFLQIMMQKDTLQPPERRIRSSITLAPTIMKASRRISDVGSEIVPSVLKKRPEQIWFWEKQPNNMMLMLGKLYIFAFTWAVGGILKREEEHEGETLIGIYTSHDDLVTVTQDFNYLVREIFERQPPANIQFPSDNKTVFDYFVDLRTGEFEPWANLVPSTQFLIQKETAGRSNPDKAEKDEEKKCELSTFIPNIDTIRHHFLMSLLLLNKHPVLIIGDPGSGKTTMIESMLQKLQRQGGLSIRMGTLLGDVFYYRETTRTSLMRSGLRSSGRTPHASAREILSTLSSPREEPDLEETCTSGTIISTLQLSAHTSAAQTKALILQKLILKSKDILGAPQFKQVLLFIDDLNTPIAEEYGSQPPLELIRQFLDLGGFYDTEQLTWKNVQDVAMVATCTPPSEGSNEISARLLSCFCTLVLPVTSLQSLQRIFQVRLGAYLHIKRFMAEVQKCKDNLTCASIAVYYRMLHKVRPTPVKCHYTFNLRDLFKVLEGLLQAHKSVIVSKESIVLLFVHECTRVFHDRLIDSPEREAFFQILSNEVNNYFKIPWTKDQLMEEPPLFVDFLDSNQPVHKRVYRNVTNKTHLLWVLEEQCIKMQGVSPQGISIVFFKEAIQHITRAARIFRQNGSHMTLVGHGGTGKVTCASLACYLSACSLYRLSISRNYTYGNFREDLKEVCKQAGVEGRRTVFLITESDIIQEAFLEDLSCILKSGQVPNLFEKEELDNIMVPLVSVAEKAKYSNTIDDIYSFFLQKVRSNLHIVLTTSYAGLTFRQRCRTYPATINCCTVDWYDTWPEEALCHVAQSYFKQDNTFQNQNISVLVQICVNIHKNVSIITEKYLKETKRHYYITPNSYLQFINTFSTILKSMKEKIMSDRTCYHSGLTKILEATSQITVMQNELLVLGPQIEKKSKEIEELVEKLHKDALVVEQVRAIVKEDEEIMAAETQTVEEYAQQATDELNAVMPTLEKAVAALDALDKNHIAEIRVYARPPPLVLTVMNAVCVLLQKKPNWTTAKLLLADPGFLKRLVNLDKDNLPEKVLLQLKKYVRMPDFNPLKVGLVSVACCSMCQWVLALDHYHLVKKFVEPKQLKVAEAEELLKLAHEKLTDKQRSLVLIEQHQQNLERSFGESIAEQEMLAARKDQTTRRLHCASVLSTALKDEMARWKESVNNFDQRLQGIVGDAFVSAACIAYSGVLSASYRQQLVNDCLKLCKESNILVSPNYSLVNCMTEKNEVRKWQNAGLPLDQYSTENAIHIMYGQRYPLLIDPERQAYKWISQMSGKLRQIRVTDAHYFRTLENSMRLGEPVLLQDFSETLDSNMKPILKKEIYNKSGQDFIRIGDSEIECNQNFRLYLTTQKPNPHFLPAICSIVTMINFTVTFEGLQDQLLSAVLIKEKPEVEHRRCELLESISADLITLRELEQKSLRLLQKTDGHILDDGDLIDNLQRSKITSTEIFERVEASAATEVKIEALRESYLPIATHGAILYFVVSDLSHINYMYQFPLEWFHKIFEDSVEYVLKVKIGVSLSAPGIFKPRSLFRTQSERLPAREDENEIESIAVNFQGHINAIIEKLTKNVYKRVSSALFSENQLCFAFLMCTAIMKNKYDGNLFINKLGFIPENQWKFFLQSSIMANIMDTQDSETTGSRAFKKTPPLHWITDMMWKECRYMSTHMPAFSLLCDSLSTNSQQWRAFLNSQNVYYLISTSYRPVSPRQDPKLRESDEQESGPLIFPWEKLSAFERLILIKVLRLESLTSAVHTFVAEKLGNYYLQIGGINLKAVYEEESNAITPIILIHTQGVDIAALFLRLAQEIKGSTQHVKMISLGRGQGSKAEDLIYKSSILQGQWVFLQNCHLAASFMPRLCKIVESFTGSQTNIDPQFRLWLSSTPDPSFPIPILRKGLKIVIEPPHGLKGTLLQTFGVSGTEIVTEAVFNTTTCGPSWKRLLFSLCFFSAVVHERKKYGALGWNIPYEFNSSDLEISIQVLEILLGNQKKIPWEALRYMTGEVTYGGRVTDNWDRRCILNILDNFYNPSVLQEDFAYTTDWVYQPISEKDTLKECRAYLRSLPESDSPELFGMHHCAERAYLKSQAQLFIESVARTQPAMTTDTLIISGKKTPDEIVLEIASDIQIRLPLTVEVMGQTPETEPKEKVTFESFKSGSVWAALAKVAKGPSSFMSSTLLIVLHQEIKRYNHLLSIIMQSLHGLQQGIKGEIIFTTALEELYNSVLKNKVPELWQQHSYKSLKPLGSWIDDLVLRVTFFSMWAKQVITFMESRHQHLVVLQKLTKTTMQPGEELDPFDGSSQAHPSCFWLPAFFFPQGFLTAVLQNYARQKELPVDSLNFIHKVLPFVQDEDQSLRFFSAKEAIINKAFKESSRCETGVIVCGLYIDGACWNPTTKTLEEPELHQRFYPLPDIHFLPKKMASHARPHCLEEEEVWLLYECPLYRTPERSGTLSSTGISTNFITVVNLPSLIAPSHWITRGVALLCQLDD
uniref:dynein heavy chain 14, axonemal n=1 Tax=Podarcis muralis TaxID=64176 RepID=UPI00109F6A94|nr:dynein heavy chain 14, axonemal [Podarcis muralis]